ncbi:hypothetical protein QJS10_CPA03g00800 [Acorus calamus]|uniref:Uncharacterized protein n=1 Tax=Acorus calamus TaxID=4465 RepID=A0AAV9F6J0_ACOCL|nr:hypothetical protein QJS10_CPA03g00800 [Acorus calamus]
MMGSPRSNATLRLAPLLFLLLLLTVQLQPAESLFHLGELKTLHSLTRSLLLRVANHRSARGDAPGADRIRKIADRLSPAWSDPGIWRAAWSVWWDYARSSWSGGSSTAEILRPALSDANDLIRSLGELARIGIGRREGRVGGEELFEGGRVGSVAAAAARSRVRSIGEWGGPLRETVVMVQREMEGGELVRDCLEVVGMAFLNVSVGGEGSYIDEERAMMGSVS